MSVVDLRPTRFTQSVEERFSREENNNGCQRSAGKHGPSFRSGGSAGRNTDHRGCQSRRAEAVAGYRASKVIGSSVLNDANEAIGKIDDLLVSTDGKAPYAVLSIGGFLGMDSHLIVVPYDSLNLIDNKIVLPGGTKDSLKMLPEFKYAAK